MHQPLLSVLIFVAACSSAAQTPASTAPTAEANRGLQAASEGYKELLTMKTIDDKVLTASKGPTAVVVFASWCGHCRRELGYLGELRQEYPGLRIIGLNAYEEFQDFSDAERLSAYVSQNAPWLTEIVHGDLGTLEHFGGVQRIPTLFFYDATGQASHQFRADQGSLPTRAELAATLAEIFATPSTSSER